MIKNPIENVTQLKTAEHYLDYLKARVQSDKTSSTDKLRMREQIEELAEQIDDYRENIGIRLVVDNTNKE